MLLFSTLLKFSLSLIKGFFGNTHTYILYFHKQIPKKKTKNFHYDNIKKEEEKYRILEKKVKHKCNFSSTFFLVRLNRYTVENTQTKWESKSMRSEATANVLMQKKSWKLTRQIQKRHEMEQVVGILCIRISSRNCLCTKLTLKK